MNKSTLCRQMAKTLGISQSAAKRQLDEILVQIQRALEEGETLYLPQFGTFELRYHLPRQVRNPQTGELMETVGFNQPSFKVSAALKQLINA
ncbi:HU family DNA-binding protein [Shewanella sp. JM162201]|uniref:HU family DNA-binding protein n=1 Tax=Shewanella jiangmenensis TaxID=2837387 RepID=A0ABS5V7E1_9GAMM|nr:HU family DNA-binding protein [Shewanella jiangmenensis]MBT1445883.1 HU family DNA-binding protein [Shewanella jiangmenensis]